MSEDASMAQPPTSPLRGEAGAHRTPGEGATGFTGDSSPPHRDPLPTGESESPPRSWKRRALYAAIGAVWLLAAIGGGLTGLFESFGPPPLGRDLEVSTLVLDRNGKLLRAYLTSEGTLAAARHARAGRPDLPRSAARLRGQALLQAPRRRSPRLPARRLSIRHAWPHRLGRLDAHHAGGAAAGAAAASLARCQDQAGGARAAARMGALQGRGARPLSHARALWRQSRRHPRGVARLFRQGAAPAHARRGGAAGGAAAVAGICAGRTASRRGARRARDRVLDRIAGKGLFSDAEIAHAKQEDVPARAEANAARRAACRRPGARRHADTSA